MALFYGIPWALLRFATRHRAMRRRELRFGAYSDFIFGIGDTA